MNLTLIQLVTEHATLVLGKLGSWVPWLVSFGKWDVDEESWAALIIGWFVLVVCIVGVACWRWGAPPF